MMASQISDSPQKVKQPRGFSIELKLLEYEMKVAEFEDDAFIGTFIEMTYPDNVKGFLSGRLKLLTLGKV